MLVQRATVIAIHAKGIEVCARASVDCRLCAQGRGCGGGLISALLRRGESSIMARPGSAAFSIGESVRLEMTGGALLKAAAWVYLGPLAGLLCVVLSLYSLDVRNDLGLALGALIGLAAGALLARGHFRRNGLRNLMPTVRPLSQAQSMNE
ncbi:MAG: SoxR reducing system RseC family protein [Gammaproteobacteria bacterium]